MDPRAAASHGAQGFSPIRRSAGGHRTVPHKISTQRHWTSTNSARAVDVGQLQGEVRELQRLCIAADSSQRQDPGHPGKEPPKQRQTSPGKADSARAVYNERSLDEDIFSSGTFNADEDDRRDRRRRRKSASGGDSDTETAYPPGFSRGRRPRTKLYSRTADIVPLEPSDPRFRDVFSFHRYRLNNRDAGQGPRVTKRICSWSRRLEHVMKRYKFDGREQQRHLGGSGAFDLAELPP